MVEIEQANYAQKERRDYGGRLCHVRVLHKRRQAAVRPLVHHELLAEND